MSHRKTWWIFGNIIGESQILWYSVFKTAIALNTGLCSQLFFTVKMHFSNETCNLGIFTGLQELQIGWLCSIELILFSQFWKGVTDSSFWNETQTRHSRERQDIWFESPWEMLAGGAVYPTEEKAGAELHVCKAKTGLLCCLRTYIVQHLGAFEKDRFFFKAKQWELLKNGASRRPITYAFLVLTHVHGKTRDSLDMSFGLKEAVPRILPPLHCKHPAKACSPFLCDHSRLGENGRLPPKVFHH